MGKAPFKTYRVTRREPILAAIHHAIEASGGRVLVEPAPSRAPFEFSVQWPNQVPIRILCYAFLANKYTQSGRPVDEHRFQVKYGSNFDDYHDIYVDPARKVITLMFGVHIEEGLFIAVDPANYNPTWFSRSVEFKDGHCRLAREQTWFGWERDRSAGRRKRDMPLASNRTEALVAFMPRHFGRYVEFERLATGFDTGERLNAADRVFGASANTTAPHPLELEYGLSPEEILNVIWGAKRLATAVRGSVAEHYLGRLLRENPAVSDVVQLDEDGRPDFAAVVRGRSVTIECKNVLRTQSQRGARVDFQRTRAAKNNPCSRYYERDAFDVLAACLHPITRKWEFMFCTTLALSSHPACPGRLSQHVIVSGADWERDIERLF